MTNLAQNSTQQAAYIPSVFTKINGGRAPNAYRMLDDVANANMSMGTAPKPASLKREAHVNPEAPAPRGDSIFDLMAAPIEPFTKKMFGVRSGAQQSRNRFPELVPA
jgi:hypothetical protein